VTGSIAKSGSPEYVRPEIQAQLQIRRMSESKPFRVFVSHLFSDHPDYHRVFEYLESASNFFYVNCSDPENIPTAGGPTAIRDALLEQIRKSEIVIVISTMFQENPSLVGYMLDAAEAAELPILVLEPFGTSEDVPDRLAERASQVVGWNERLMVDAIRLEARHEETHRWDVIEFDMS